LRWPGTFGSAADGQLSRLQRWRLARRGSGRAELLAGPIHGAPLGAEQLAEKAREVGRRESVRARSSARGSAPLLVRLSQTRKLLDDACSRLATGASREVDVGPAGDWLLDNYHVVQEHIREIRETLPPGYYRELPELASGPLAGYPRVYELAIALISHTEARIEPDNLEPFIAAYQESAPLSIGELWALPAMLRLALIESVRRMALRTVERMVALERADAWAARIESASREDAAALGRALDAFVATPPPLTPVFISRFLRRLRLVGGEHAPLEVIEEWIVERAMSAEDATARSTQHLALTQLMVAHGITSLRTIGRLDWQSLIERQSRLESELLEDPAGQYGGMSFATRDRYRHVVERISRGSGRSEVEVARTAVRLARSALSERGAAHVRSHVGYFLLDGGLVELEAAVGYRLPLRSAVRRWVQGRPDAVYMGGLIAATLLALVMLVWLAGRSAEPVWLAVVLLGLIPAAHLAVTAVHLLITTLVAPRELAALDLHEAGGVPPQYRTAVVVPTLLDGVAAVEETLEHLEVQYLANRSANLHFAVLGDFTDADTETRAEDDVITAAAIAGVDALNARYVEGGSAPFCLFLRPRRWNGRQGCWMGWERKRGKLAEFNRFLRGSEGAAFSAFAGDVEAVRGARYVITLDADTVLPPGAALALIGALAHPLNRAVYDEARGRVVRGYGILQPRVAVSLPSAHRSRFAAIHSGHPGVDPYTTAYSDVYQDLYGEGSFTGKGIYDVDAFERATHGRFPENTLLSHDLIEGSYARAGLASGISVYDDYPAHYLTFTRRKHRWIRGDWQLLRWLTASVPGPDGRERNRLPVLARWKLLDNLRRSTVELGQFLFIVAGWTVLPGSPLRWTALGVGAVAGPWIIALGFAALRPPLDRSWRAYYAAVARDAWTSAQQVGLAIAFLPHQAWISGDAIARTLWRLAKRRRLLEWQTASTIERGVVRGRRAAWRAMGPAVALAAAAVCAVALRHAGGGGSLTLWLPVGTLAALWSVSPLIAHGLSGSALRRVPPLTPAQREQALELARLHWNFFERFVTPETRWLAPDNYQEDPDPVVAMRTSPTNIGLQLLAIGSARDLGFIDTAGMTQRLERVFGTLERMRRFRGHFFNWYDLHDLRVLEPAYISTVDSGNLAGHLIAVRQACLAAMGDVDESGDGMASMAPDDTTGECLRARLAVLAARAAAYVGEMDFRFLFDEEQELFSIGYQHAAQLLDASSYDLLASEARLASFVAVAKNEAPLSHWFRLGRALTSAGGSTALVSWSGSMFEYLMPALVMRAYPGTLLDHTYRGVVRQQIAHGRMHGVPWGVSESAYNVRDRELTYQYRAFGVPDLGLKRGLGRDLVIAPYASALALMVDPAAALANLARLADAGALGPHGFRDALDFTRPPRGDEVAVVGTYMAHHVGMSLVALTNVLTDGLWQQRFHEDALVRSAELLLHERIPRRVVVHAARPESANQHAPTPDAQHPAVRSIDDPDTERPHVTLLGRQPYTVMISHCGAGYSRFEDLAVTRWQADGTADATGQFCYVSDVTTGRLWSSAHQPVCAPADAYRALLGADRVTFERSDGDVETRTEVTVVPDDAAEVRRVVVTNRSDETREIELTSYGEIVLGPAAADAAHPAFANLFVETEWHEWCSAITATRRPRSAGERRLWCVHVVDAPGAAIGPVTCETDRARFVGRGRTTRLPAAAVTPGPLSGTTGAVLDPVFALRVRLRLEPGASAGVAFTTLVATSREQAFELADRYHGANASRRALDLAWTSQQVELGELGVTPSDAAAFMELAGHILYPRGDLRAPAVEREANRGSRQDLWREGISGDLPVVLATIDSADGLPTLRQVFAAHHLWRRRGLLTDLVVLNTRTTSYLEELTGQIGDALFASSDTGRDQPGGVFIRALATMDDDAFRMLRATAVVVLHCDGRSLANVVHPPTPAAAARVHVPVPAASRPRRVERQQAETRRVFAGNRHRERASVSPVASAPWPETVMPPADTTVADPALLFDNGLGGLAPTGEYVIRILPGALPPAPWLNVVANERGGFTVSERGAGFTWADSSYFFRLTPWHNDPVSDPLSDVLYLTDEASGATWSATPGPIASDAGYVVRHGAGSSTFECTRDEIGTHLTLAMAGDEPVRLSLLRITNHGARARRLRITAYVEWTLGVTRAQTRHHVRTAFEPDRSAILARNGFDSEYAGDIAFCALSEPVSGHTADRLEFLGRNGSTADPAGLRRDALSGGGGADADPCAALQCVLELAAGETRVVVVLLGAAGSEAEAHDAIARLGHPGAAAAAVGQGSAAWQRRLSTIVVRTPDPAFDALLNHWLLYQALSCRMWARSALYQSSGAYGYRDQLQDSLAILHAEPGLARRHLLRAAARQFEEGDVQHWWHPRTGSGVRTRFSDDLVWLPYVVDEYLERTGDAGLLDEPAPFLAMRALEPDEHEAYDRPAVTAGQASVYEHCVLALRRACTAGAHGLPLIGTGDWNDGMNRVGMNGRGESVWLAWFLITTLRRFARHADAREDHAVADGFRARADGYAAAAETHGWDGAWYRRAFFDDGSTLGSADDDECRIDAIAQSWSVLSGAGLPERQRLAMKALDAHLVDDRTGILRLLTPPFDATDQDPGYIRGYLPGVRENGAQYTHAAVWTVMATALRGDTDRAFELYRMLNPLLRSSTPDEVATYKVEPYVVAADVYTAAGQVGRGGWTWYTGAAGWMYRLGLETILGFTRRGDLLRIEPRVPHDWTDFSLEYRFGSSQYVITVVEPGRIAAAGSEVRLDDRWLESDAIPLLDDGHPHTVLVRPRGSGLHAP
jgi:cyclic beta-1,2-glucan synthetase